MKFYCIVNKTFNGKCFTYLKQACEERDIEFVPLEAETLDYGQNMDDVVETPSILLRLSIGERTRRLESLLMKEGVGTVYATQEAMFMRSFPWGDSIRLRQAGLPIIPTIFNLSPSQDAHLTAYVEKLGGYPVVLKASGGSHGASVLRLDSVESLRSVAGYVTRIPGAHFALLKYVERATHIRMVVVGNRVVDAIRYLPQPDDFRTNAVAVPTVEAFPHDEKTAQLFDLSVQATAALGLEFGGVDLLIDEQGVAYIAEVNTPCNFARNQENTGTDIAGALIDHLVAKAKS